MRFRREAQEGSYRMRGRLRCAMFLLAALAVTPQAFPQKPSPDNAVNTTKVAREPDFSGVWMALPGRTFGAFETKEPPSMQPSAEATFKSITRDKDPVWKCYPPGFPRILLVPQPMEIIQIPGRVLMLNEYDHTLRHVYMDGRGHPKDPDPTWLGHSIGKWDGDTLVVDTIGLNDKTWLDYLGHPHTEDLHVVERYRRVDPTTLRLEITIDDPKTYTKTWTGQLLFKLKPDWEISEHFACDSENRIAPAPVAGN